MKAVLRKNGAILIERVELSLGIFARMKGLLGRESLGAGSAMYLSPCGSIHTFFMKFNLDVVFLDRTLVVLKIVSRVCPSRVVFGGRGARGVLELESGWMKDGMISVGDRLELG